MVFTSSEQHNNYDVTIIHKEAHIEISLTVNDFEIKNIHNCKK